MVFRAGKSFGARPGRCHPAHGGTTGQPGAVRHRFSGRHLQSITSTNQLQADIQVGAGYKLEPPHLIRNTVTDGWRLAFQLTADPGDALRGKLLPSTVPPVDVRAVLKHDKLALTEIWNYSYPP